MDDHDTGFHDHDVSAGAVAVVGGRVREERLAIDGPTRDRVFGPGESFHFSAADIHRVRHAGGGPAVTLHVYSPPLLRMGAYVVGEDGVLERHTVEPEEELRPLSGLPPFPRSRVSNPDGAVRRVKRILSFTTRRFVMSAVVVMQTAGGGGGGREW